MIYFRDVFRNPVHGAISTPGMLEGRDKVSFTPGKVITEEVEKDPSGDSSLSNLSSVISIDKINAELHERDSQEMPTSSEEQNNTKQMLIPTLSEPPEETLNDLNTTGSIKRKIGMTMSAPLFVSQLNVTDSSRKQDENNSSRIESQMSEVSCDENDRRGSGLSENLDKTSDTRL